MRERITTENRDIQATKLLRFLDKIHATEVFSSDDKKRELIQRLSFVEFKNVLQQINGLLRDLPKKDRGFDGKHVELVSEFGASEMYIPPAYEDKEMLLQELFQEAKQMKI